MGELPDATACGCLYVCSLSLGALRDPVTQQAAACKHLGWIAVSSDDDKPHSPVNIPPLPFQQFEIPVTVAVGPVGTPCNVTIQTRFFIASARDDTAPVTIVPSSRTLNSMSDPKQDREPPKRR